MTVNTERLYLGLAIIGAVAPWIFFALFFAENGLDPVSFLAGLFANGAAGGFTVDVLISLLIFWVWSWHDAGKRGLENWHLVLLAGCTAGLSFAMPLYFYLCARQTADA